MTFAKLTELLLKETNDALLLQRAGGSMPAGNNGSYGDPETPLRSTAHGLFTFCMAYETVKETKFHKGAELALHYILATLALNPGCVMMRHAQGKDFSNGVLGPAFIVEALAAAWKILGSLEARDAALSIILKHNFNENKLCWNRVSPAGDRLSPDMTFNHQLYFAATAAMFRREEPRIQRDLDCFMAGWPTTLRVRDDGRIVHEIEFLGKLASLRKRLLSKPNAKNVLSAKEADYHSYNCYAFALLASSGVDVPLAAGAKWTLIDRFLNSERIQATLKPQAWSTPIRSGTETRVGDFVFFSQVFGGKYDVDAAASFLVHVHGPDGNASIFSPDPIMQKARSYRYWRLLNPRIFAPKT